MNYNLRMTREVHRRLAALLRAALPSESVCFILCRRFSGLDAVTFLTDELIEIPVEEFRMQGPDIASVSAPAMAAIAKQARLGEHVVVMAHLHPGTEGWAEFSAADHIGNARSFAFFHQRVKSPEHIALVFDEPINTCRGLVYFGDGTTAALSSCLVVDEETRRDLLLAGESEGMHSSFARQAMLLGTAGQQRLSALRIGIVGLGGIGSLISTLAVHHGFQKMVLIDDDVLEDTNAPRVIGSTPVHLEARTLKVDIAASYALAHNPAAEVLRITDCVESDEARAALLGCDVIVICTDNTTSRAFLNQLAQQYLIALLDLGVEFVVDEKRTIANEVGRINLARPATPCLVCSGQIDFRRLAAEAVPKEEREREGSYLRGMDDPQPSMMAFNMEVAARGMQILIGHITGAMPTGIEVLEQRTFFRRRGGSLSRLVAKRGDAGCIVCGAQGVVGKGNDVAMAITRRAL